MVPVQAAASDVSVSVVLTGLAKAERDRARTTEASVSILFQKVSNNYEVQRPLAQGCVLGLENPVRLYHPFIRLRMFVCNIARSYCQKRLTSSESNEH